MIDKNNPNRLIVEGDEDLFSIVGLMEHHTAWPNNQPPVYIEKGASIEKILKREFLTVPLKSPLIRRLGVIVDADENAEGRYQALRKTCVEFFPDLPRNLAPTGLIADNTEKRLGLWVMPNNADQGALESFLEQLVPEHARPLWTHAIDSVTHARNALGATCRDTHLKKAHLFTWLAWQDPPGQNAGRALTQKALNPHAAHATAFIDWFLTLYQLHRTLAPSEVRFDTGDGPVTFE